MSRRTLFIAAALLVLVGTRMPGWRAAGLAASAVQAPATGGATQEWSGARAAWQWAPALRRRLGWVLTWEGS